MTVTLVLDGVSGMCRDYAYEEAPIWASSLLRCAHCRETWIGLYVMRRTYFYCPFCDQITRKRILRSGLNRGTK